MLPKSAAHYGSPGAHQTGLRWQLGGNPPSPQLLRGSDKSGLRPSRLRTHLSPTYSSTRWEGSRGQRSPPGPSAAAPAASWCIGQSQHATGAEPNTRLALPLSWATGGGGEFLQAQRGLESDAGDLEGGSRVGSGFPSPLKFTPQRRGHNGHPGPSAWFLLGTGAPAAGAKFNIALTGGSKAPEPVPCWGATMYKALEKEIKPFGECH